MKNAVIFDLDGTLVDSEPAYREAWRKAFLPLQVELNDREMVAVMGLGPRKCAQIFLDNHKTSGNADALAAEMLRLAELSPQRGLMPGAETTIQLALANNFKIAVATAAPYGLAEATLLASGLGHYFDIVVSTENEKFGKPYPDVFLTAARELKADPSSCIVIEDSVNGVLAAKAAHMQCVVVPEPSNRDNETIRQADVVLDSLEALTIQHLGLSQSLSL